MVGVFVGTFIVFMITGYFNVFLYQNVRIITQIIGILGGLFILYLAVVMFQTRENHDSLMITSDKLFTMAVLLTLINPKAIIFGLTVASFYLNLDFSPNGMWILSFINAFLCFVSVLVWGYLGQAFKRLMAQYQTIFNVVMAVLLGYSGVLIIYEVVKEL
jgi:threonine/homoserine/homoserine lactone efflux protein